MPRLSAGTTAMWLSLTVARSITEAVRRRKLNCAEVFEHGHSGVAAVDTDDGAAWVRACAAEVEAFHGCAGGEATAVHVGREALALEDVSTGQTDFLFDVGGTEDLCVD